MYLKELSLHNFKNYHSSHFEFCPALNVLTGENGAGKTNVLDAIHYLCLGKSYFHGNDQQAVRHEENYFRIAGSFTNEQENVSIACAYQSGSKKELTKNNVLYQRLVDHVGLLPVVMMAPDDHYLIDESSEERRRFIDYTLSQIDRSYLDDLVSYNKVLQQRNAALKQFLSRNFFDGSLIESLDAQLIVFGGKIFRGREMYLKKMIPLIGKYYAFISGEKEMVHSVYDSVFLREDFATALRNSLDKDRLLQRTTEGIHRDEIEFFLNDRPVKKFGSQGQKKSFLMALKLAQFELLQNEIERTPLLLLDDLFDKLDEKRARHILNLVMNSEFRQIFMTDTQGSRIQHVTQQSSKPIKFFELGGNKSGSESGV